MCQEESNPRPSDFALDHYVNMVINDIQQILLSHIYNVCTFTPRGPVRPLAPGRPSTPCLQIIS